MDSHQQQVSAENNEKKPRYFICPRVFMLKAADPELSSAKVEDNKKSSNQNDRQIPPIVITQSGIQTIHKNDSDMHTGYAEVGDFNNNQDTNRKCICQWTYNSNVLSNIDTNESLRRDS